MALIEDAVRNGKAAVEEGIVPGGGATLLHAGAGLFEGPGLAGDEATGANTNQRSAAQAG